MQKQMVTGPNDTSLSSAQQLALGPQIVFSGSVDRDSKGELLVGAGGGLKQKTTVQMKQRTQGLWQGVGPSVVVLKTPLRIRLRAGLNARMNRYSRCLTQCAVSRTLLFIIPPELLVSGTSLLEAHTPPVPHSNASTQLPCSLLSRFCTCHRGSSRRPDTLATTLPNLRPLSVLAYRTEERPLLSAAFHVCLVDGPGEILKRQSFDAFRCDSRDSDLCFLRPSQSPLVNLTSPVGKFHLVQPPSHLFAHSFCYDKPMTDTVSIRRKKRLHGFCFLNYDDHLPSSADVQPLPTATCTRR